MAAILFFKMRLKFFRDRFCEEIFINEGDIKVYAKCDERTDASTYGKHVIIPTTALGHRREIIKEASPVA